MTNNNIKATSQRIELIELDRCVPTNYQRETKDGQVENIVSRFTEDKLGVLTVSLRDGNLHIVDGLHRSKALKAEGYTHALAVILTGMTYEQEAEFFREQNENKRPISTLEDFHAGLEANNPMCILIDKTLKAHNFQIGRGSNFYKIGCITTLTTIVKDYGYTVLEDTLRLLADTWAGIPSATESTCLLGVAKFVKHYGLCHFAERMKNKFAVVCYEYAEAMKMSGTRGSNVSRNKFCRILVQHYNRGLNGNSKKRLIWEERHER